MMSRGNMTVKQAITLDPHLSRDAADIATGLGNLSQRFADKSILLTGAAGFLGSQFVHYFSGLNELGLIDSPCQIRALDTFQRGKPEWVHTLENRDYISFQSHDITEPAAFGRHDFVIHAASIASPIFYRRHPIETMDANVTGLRNLLDDAVRNKPVSFLFFSTSEIYGDPQPEWIPTPENYRGNVSCTGPRACYDESKRYGETLCVNFWRTHQVPVKIARPFNNFGPGLKISDRRVLPDFFRDIIDGKDLELLSDGSATRTFCYVADAIEGYLRILLSDHNGESFNIGTREPEVSMLDLARMVIDVTGSNAELKHTVSDDPDYLVDNPNRRCPDISKAQKMIDYTPRISLREGLERSYEYYLDNRTATDG